MQTSDGLSWLNSEVPNANGIVIHNPLYLPLMNTEPMVELSSILSKDQRFIMGVGRLENSKGFDVLIEAFQSVCGKLGDVHLVIAGEGPMYSRLRNSVNSKENRGKIHLLGRVGNLQDWYNHASLFVSTSVFEGFPNALLEALGSGVPAIAFDCKTGPNEIISVTDQGLLLPLDTSPDELGIAIVDVMNSNPPENARLVQAKKINAKFSIETIANKWLNLLSINRQHDET